MFAVLGGCFAVAVLLGTAMTGVGVAFAAYSVLFADRRRGASWWSSWVMPSSSWPLSAAGGNAHYFFLDAITFAMVIALAELVPTRRAYVKICGDRAAQLERERVSLAEAAVDGERLRIARELHDVVAHAISSIAVQSSVALDQLRKDPDATARALATIVTSSRAALAEMRRMLAILRNRESPDQLVPSPGWRTSRH